MREIVQLVIVRPHDLIELVGCRLWDLSNLDQHRELSRLECVASCAVCSDPPAGISCDVIFGALRDLDVVVKAPVEVVDPVWLVTHEETDEEAADGEVSVGFALQLLDCITGVLLFLAVFGMRLSTLEWSTFVGRAEG